MRIAIISDIHSNADALVKVLDDIKRFDVDNVISLGDNIGYGPEPNETVSLLVDNNIQSVIGNHELAILNENLIKHFNPLARFALKKTITQINKNTLNYIKSCSKYLSLYGCHFVHGMPPDSQTSYMSKTSATDLKNLFNRIYSKICFIGHTHELKLALLKDRKIKYEDLDEGLYSLNEESRYLISAGSVGQPRDRNKDAKYLIFDNVTYKIAVRFIDYNRDKVIEKMLELGYPKDHTIRLK
jgi:predicted phosphodiesterase